MSRIWGWIKSLFGFAASDIRKELAGGITLKSARGLVKAYLEHKRSQLVAKAREVIKKAAEDGRDRVILELKELDDSAREILRAQGFTVTVDETGGKWIVSWSSDE